MQESKHKILPLWAIWLIAIAVVVAWCVANPDDDARTVEPATMHRASNV
ncbi:hypothetical protein HDG38_005745 [Paraburkholderia sp. WSM4177]|nr:hypothetical protein [Paraburkholderia sp. WSM4177]MBB5487649.1 hypothetical protein [Paraburkholderia sp. WSM4180]